MRQGSESIKWSITKSRLSRTGSPVRAWATQLGNQPPNGNHYEPEDVQRMMRELWEEFVAKNPDMFKT